MRRTKTLGPLLILLLATSALALETNTPARDPKWATPLKIEGLPNLHKVSDSLYRGAQPTAEGFKELKKMGIKTVFSLRAFHSDKELLGDTGLAYEEVSFKTWHTEQADTVKFLGIAMDKSKQPVFVHCQHGADRTGTMCALYRVVVDGWTKEQALKEMTEGGFGFHPMWNNLIKFVNELNIDEVKKSLQPATATTKNDVVPRDAGRR